MVNLTYPALYGAADKGAGSAQKRFLWAVRLELGLLLLTALANSTRPWTDMPPHWLILALVVLSGLLVWRYFAGLDQNWYQCRALAESVKTSSWRYAMRAHPFEDAEKRHVPESTFRSYLSGILSASRHIGSVLSEQTARDSQITEGMNLLRAQSVADRLEYYLQKRVSEQRDWYAKKSKHNRSRQALWVLAAILMYVIAALTLYSVQFMQFDLVPLFDPIIVSVTGILAWLQIKRHGELAASYNLTAHEIGILESVSNTVTDEDSLSEFVNEAELAFSREHTQWTARRDAS